MDTAVGDIIGRRSEQQDSARFRPIKVDGDREAVLAIVCDGMGGAVGGRRASQVACEVFETTFLRSAATTIGARFKESLTAANAAIADAVKRDSGLQGMGCTLVGMVTDGVEVSWISVGDSLLLSARRGGLRRLNEDHSLAAVLDRAAERGEITLEQAQTSDQRSVLRSALTGGPIALVDQGSEALKDDVRLLVATDGLLTLSNVDIARLAQEPVGAADLVELMLSKISADMPSNQDNVTIVAMIPRGAAAAKRLFPPWAMVTIGLGFGVLVAVLIALALTSGLIKGPALNGLSASPPPTAVGQAKPAAAQQFKPATQASAVTENETPPPGPERSKTIIRLNTGEALSPPPKSPAKEPVTKSDPPNKTKVKSVEPARSSPAATRAPVKSLPPPSAPVVPAQASTQDKPGPAPKPVQDSDPKKISEAHPAQ